MLDAHPKFIEACKILGSSFDPMSLQTSFKLCDEDVFVVFVFIDVCHTLKLLRNLLGDKDLIDGNGNEIRFQYFSDLNSIQNREGLHLGNKLTNKHIYYQNHKMKVKLALSR